MNREIDDFFIARPNGYPTPPTHSLIHNMDAGVVAFTSLRSATRLVIFHAASILQLYYYSSAHKPRVCFAPAVI